MAVTAKTGEERLQEMDVAAKGLQYIPSENVTQANAQLASVAQGKPAEYSNENAEQLGGLYDSLINREAFRYEAPNDALYQQYKQQYQQLGMQGANTAKQTTREISGGYGDTWSGAAAGQQYGEYLKGMNDIVPALEQNAYGAYQAEGNRLSAQLSAAQNRDDTAYGRWQDQYQQWFNDRTYATNRAQQEYANDYTRYSDNINNAMTVLGWEREDAETVRSNAYSWAMSLIKNGIMPIDTVLEQAGISQENALALAEKYGYGSGSGGGGGRKKRGRGGRRRDTEAPTPQTQVDIISGAAPLRRKRR